MYYYFNTWNKIQNSINGITDENIMQLSGITNNIQSQFNSINTNLSKININDLKNKINTVFFEPFYLNGYYPLYFSEETALEASTINNITPISLNYNNNNLTLYIPIEPNNTIAYLGNYVDGNNNNTNIDIIPKIYNLISQLNTTNLNFTNLSLNINQSNLLINTDINTINKQITTLSSLTNTIYPTDCFLINSINSNNIDKKINNLNFKKINSIIPINFVIDFNRKQIDNIDKKINCILNLQPQAISNRISKNIYNNLNTNTNNLYYLKAKTYSKDQIDDKFNKLLSLKQDFNDLYYLKNETYSIQYFSNFINAISNNISNNKVNNKIKHNYYYNLNNNITVSKKTDTNEKKIVNLISNHNHNNIYFTKTEVSSLINASISNVGLNDSVINPIINFNNKLDTDLFYTKKQINDNNKKINCFLNLQRQIISNKINKNIYNNLNTITNDLYYLKSKTYSKDQIDSKFNKLLNLEQDTNDLYYLKNETYSIQDFSNFINSISNNISNNKVNNKIKHNYYYNLNNNITISKKTDTTEKKIVNLISNHNHNNIYFTKTEVSSLINASISNVGLNDSVINPIINFNNKLDTDLFYTKKQTNNINKKINCFLNLQQQNTIKIKNTLQPMITTNVSNKISKNIYNNLNTITNDLYYLKVKTYSKDQIDDKFNKLLNLEQDTNDLYYLKNETYSTQDFSNFINAISNNISNSNSNKIKHNYYYNLNNNITISKKTDTNEKKIVNLISNHNHNNIYFTKTEVSSLINASISNVGLNDSVINPIINFNNKLDTDLFYTKKQTNNINKKINCFLNLQQQNTIKIKNTLQPMITTNVSNRISKNIYNNLNTITNDLYYLKSKTYSKDQIDNKFNKLLNLEQDTNDLYYLKNETYSTQDFSNFINAISNNISNSNSNKIKHNYYYNLNNNITISKKTDTNEKKIVNLISNHNHNNIYFTKSEVSGLINASISNNVNNSINI